jgi:hypothetical protein
MVLQTFGFFNRRAMRARFLRRNTTLGAIAQDSVKVAMSMGVSEFPE